MITTEVRDISYSNTIIDPIALKQAVGAVLVKIGQKNWEDVHFKPHTDIAIANNIPFAGWWFMHPDYDWEVQANKCLDIYRSRGKKFRIYLDCEIIKYEELDGTPVLIEPRSKEEYTYWITSWLEKIEHETGIVPGVYTAFYFWQKWVYESGATYVYNGVTYTAPDWSHYDLWVANWDAVTPMIPHGWKEGSWKFWQYGKTDTPGIFSGKDKTDSDRFNGMLAELMSYLNIDGGGVVIVSKNAFISSNEPMDVLDIPYKSQIGKGADANYNDCGAAASASVIWGYTTNRPTVDEVHVASGQPADVYLSAYQLIAALQHYEVSASWKLNNTISSLINCVSGGRPLISLILYAPLVDNNLTEDKNFRGFHFVTVVGYNAPFVVIHDPLWKMPDPNDDTKLPKGALLKVEQGIFDMAWQKCGASGANPAYGAVIPDMVLGIAPPVAGAFANFKFTKTYLKVRSSASDATETNVLFYLTHNQIVPLEINPNGKPKLYNGWGKIYQKEQYLGTYYLEPA